MKKIIILALGLLFGSSASAQIYYTDVDPDTVITGLVTYATGDTYLIDLDGNGTTDYHFVKLTLSSPDPVWDFGYIQDGGSGPATNEFMGEDPGTGIRQVFNLNLGDNIGPTETWSTVGGGNSEFILNFPDGGLLEGLWLGDDDGYAGLRFDSSGTECYAWIRMGFSADHKTMTVKEWAYSCTGDLDSAGQMPAPECIAPMDLTASAITINSVDLGWTELNGATEWEVEYGLSGFGTGTGTAVITSSNPLSVSGLTDDTSYDFYVRSICGVGDTSEWSALGTFETILDDVGFEDQALTQILISPNPAKDQLNLQFNKNISGGEIRILNMIGQEVMGYQIDGTSYLKLDVSNLPTGRYVYQIKADDALFNGKLLIE